MSWSSAVVVEFMLKSIGMPISLDSSFGAPALVMADENGAKIPFYVGEPSSGTYSIVGLSVFSIFVAYILRGPLWKRAMILVVGFPVFYMLNAIRISASPGPGERNVMRPSVMGSNWDMSVSEARALVT